MRLQLLHIGIVLRTFGEILIALTAIRVHRRYWKGHKVDDVLFDIMKNEQLVAIIGLAVLILGAVLEFIYTV